MTNTCISCGAEIPEGTQVCYNCTWEASQETRLKEIEDRNMRWTPEELDYLKALYKLKTDYSLHRLADIAAKNLGRPAAAIEAKLEHLTASGEIWK
jgi:hypothetical protein